MRRLVCALLATSAIACAPDLNIKASRVVGARVIAVRSTPAEVTPGSSVNWDAVVVTPLPTPDDIQIAWVMCEAPRSPSDSITVTSACLAPLDPAQDGGVLTAIPNATGASVQGSVPGDACRTIGPEVPQTDAMGNPQRVPDADITGGYQLPIRLTLTDASNDLDVSFDRQRVRCSLANAPADAAREYAARYVANENPGIGTVVFAGSPSPADGTVNFGVHRGAKLPIAIQWDASAQESYVAFDPGSRTIVDRVETLEISWYTNGGSFDHDRTTPDTKGATQSSNTLDLDADIDQPITVWILLRDDRGGVGVATLQLIPQ